MTPWVEELETKLNALSERDYNKLKGLKEEKFQGQLRINFVNGVPKSFNLYDTVRL